jgi:tetratricopeptide (TPR) repeat protein
MKKLYLVLRFVLAAMLLTTACGKEEAPPDPVEGYVDQGDRAYLMQNLQEAVEHYQKAIQSGAQTVKVYNNLGNAYFKDDRFNAAQQSFMKALDLDPEYLFALNNISHALYQNGEVDEAYRIIEEAQKNFPDISFLHTTYGYFRYREGDIEGARKAFEKAKELNPDSPAALNNLGVLYAEDPDSKEDPLPFLLRALEKDPSNELFHDSLGWYYFNKGMFTEATLNIGKAFQYDPGNVEVHIHYATVLEWIGKDAEALEQWEKIKEVTEDSRVRNLAMERSWEIRGRTGGN